MPKLNPQSVLDAILAEPIQIAKGIAVYPLSLDLFAKLDAIGCPVLRPGPKCRASEMIPSYYLATHPEAPLATVADDSAAWARSVPAGLLKPIALAFGRQMEIAEAVVPTGSGDGSGPKARTAG